MGRACFLVVALSLALAGCKHEAKPQPVPTPAIHTPRWAFEPWISKDISDTDDTYAFVAGFRERDIPVGVVVLDSPWETNYHTFVPNPTRYHDFAKLVSDLRADDIRVVMWMTQMINRSSVDVEEGGDVYDGPSPNFQEAFDQGYLVDHGQDYYWWKGFGAGLDFFNPWAVEWWHAQQDAVLDVGISGWKLDFGDEYLPDADLATYAGPVPRQQYSEEYYRDFWAHGVQRAGSTDEFVTMVRPYDRSYGFPGRFYARPEHAPVGWVGDNRRDYVGLADALDHIFRSAQAGYVVVGSDIGGYLDRDDIDLTQGVPWDTEVFARWTALGAFTPFMELHGRANITPWTVPDRVDETVAMYRRWATLHHELVPFFYSLAEECYANGGAIIRPEGDEAAWPDDYRFQVGDALLVAPVLESGGIRDVLLPDGARWFDFNDPYADPVAGGTLVGAYDASDWQRFPVFVREGAIVPADVASDVTGLGSATSAGFQTYLVWPDASESSFVLHDTDGATTTITASTPEVDSGRSHIVISRATARGVILRVRVGAPVSAVGISGDDLFPRADRATFEGAGSGFWPDPPFVWIKYPPVPGELIIGTAP
jgi:alpha-glucosidase (family GH31 glycosyl hydrolase)